MKKQGITLFGSGVAVGILITMLFIVIMRKPDNQTNFAEDTAYTQDTKSHEITLNINVEEILDTIIEETCSNHALSDTDNAMSNTIQFQEFKLPIQLKDENGVFTSEALELAKKYLVLYNNNEWKGNTIIDSESGIQIREHGGIIQLEGEDTPIRTEERTIYDNAVEAYMSGEWDGTEMVVNEGHTIKLLEGAGYVLIDGDIVAGQVKKLDMPESAYELFGDNPDLYTYVPGQGTYAIIDKKLVKFLRGEQITLPGERLSWKGIQGLEDYCSKIEEGDGDRTEYVLPKLIHNKIDGKLYLITSCSLYNDENYVYVFDDCNISKMRYIGKF